METRIKNFDRWSISSEITIPFYERSTPPAENMSGGSRRQTGSNKEDMRGEESVHAWHSSIGAR